MSTRHFFPRALRTDGHPSHFLYARYAPADDRDAPTDDRYAPTDPRYAPEDDQDAPLADRDAPTDIPRTLSPYVTHRRKTTAYKKRAAFFLFHFSLPTFSFNDGPL